MSTYITKPTYPVITDPTDLKQLPSATIRLTGLLCLAFDGSNKCTIGVNRADLSHKWKLRIREWGDATTEQVWSQSTHSTYKEIEIKVTGGTTGPATAGSPKGTNGAFVYAGGDVTTLPGEKRFNLESSWVDLEGARGHNTEVKNDPNTLYPRFYFNDALLCASRLSTGLFDLKNTKSAPDVVPLDRVAIEAAADIFLDGDENSKIEVIFPNGDKVTLKNKRYEIFISNNCETSCRPDEIDFSLHYGAFSGAFSGGTLSTPDKFNLIRRSITDGPVDSGVADATDRAPCMKVTLGQTKVFNP